MRTILRTIKESHCVRMIRARRVSGAFRDSEAAAEIESAEASMLELGASA